MNTTEGNFLIADFMGLVKDGKVQYPVGEGYYSLQYHSSWDWLMPVVDKIESYGKPPILPDHLFRVDIDGHLCVVVDDGDGFIEVMGSSKIDSVWRTIVQFIEWYNTQK